MAAARRAGSRRSVPADHIGRPVFATNAAGVKVWSAVYTPFGGVYTSSGALPNARFPGQWYQAESGLHQNWMRDYDPTTGRYLQADPLGPVDGASVYGYVRQSPMMFSDPTGEFIPVVVGLLLGLIIDAVVDKLEVYCGCDEGDQLSQRCLGCGKHTARMRADLEALIPSKEKGLGEGGSPVIGRVPGASISVQTRVTLICAARRAWGRKAAKRIPYVGAVLGLHDASRLGSCLYNRWSLP